MKKIIWIMFLIFLVNTVQAVVIDEYTECIDEKCYFESKARFINDNGIWRNITDVFSFWEKDGVIYLECFNETIMIDTYYISDDVEYEYTAIQKAKGQMQEITIQDKPYSLSTTVTKYPDRYYYFHELKDINLSSVKKIERFGYRLPDECTYYKDYISCELACGTYNIDLTQAREEQNLTINTHPSDAKDVQFEGHDLSLIDPSVSQAESRAMIDDAMVLRDDAATNYGSNESLKVGVDAFEDTDHMTLIKVDFSSLTHMVSVNSSTFYIYVSIKPGGEEYVLYRNCPTGTWNESNITWNNHATEVSDCAGTNYIHADTQGAYASFDISSRITIEKDLDKRFTMRLQPYAYGSNDCYTFPSVDAGANLPYFTLVYDADTTEPNVTLQSPYTTTDRNATITITTDENATCKWAFVDVNYSLMNWTMTDSGTSHTFNYTDFTINSNASLYVACNDSYDNPNNSTTNFNSWLVLNNSLPSAENVTITPSGADGLDDLHCVYNYSDDDSDAQVGVEYKWFNGTNDVSINSDILGAGNTSDGENWTCSVRVNDTYNWGNWTNSSTVTLNDTVNPSIWGCTVSTSSATQNDVVDFCCYATDNNYFATGYPKMQIRDPNLATYNYSYTSSTGNQYCTSLTVGTPGTYLFQYGHAMDGNGNTNSSEAGLSVYVEALVGGGTGAGGGTPVSSNGSCGLYIIQPSIKKAYIYGRDGKGKTTIIVYNNLTQGETVYYSLDNILEQNCDIEAYSLEISGESYLKNTLACNLGFPYEGRLNIEFGDGICDTDIIVYVDLESWWMKAFVAIITGSGTGILLLAGFILLGAFVLFIVSKST